MSLHVTRYLETHSLEDLHTHFAINAKTHSAVQNIYQLTYSQLNSPFENPIVQECRNLIIDFDPTRESHRAHVIALGFKKFFNFAEPNAASVVSDFEPPLRVYEKMDGSIMMLYWLSSAPTPRWEISSSSLPDARGTMQRKNRPGMKKARGPLPTFGEKFWEVWHWLGYGDDVNSILDRSLCYVFELITENNVILVRYPDSELPKLVLLGVRNCTTLKELRPEPVAESLGWQCISPIDTLLTLTDVVAKAREIDPIRCEGFVAVDLQFRRLKIKSPAYVALHCMNLKVGGDWRKEEFNRSRLLRIVAINESEEFLAYYPMLKRSYGEVQRKYNVFCLALEEMKNASVLGQQSEVIVGEESVPVVARHFDVDAFVAMASSRFETTPESPNAWDSLLRKIGECNDSVRVFLSQMESDELNELSAFMNSFRFGEGGEGQQQQEEEGGREEEEALHWDIENSVEKVFRENVVSKRDMVRIEQVQLDLVQLFNEEKEEEGTTTRTTITFPLTGLCAAGIALKREEIEFAMMQSSSLDEVNPDDVVRVLSGVSYYKRVRIGTKKNDNENPVVKFFDLNQRLNVVLILRNAVDRGLETSALLKSFFTVDERVRRLAVLVRLFLKVRGIKEESEQQLLLWQNPYPVILMMIGFLQSGVSPAVLPAAAAMMNSIADEEQEEEEGEENETNEEGTDDVGIGKLLQLFFRFYSSEFDFASLRISVRRGTMDPLIADEQTTEEETNRPAVWIEDPLMNEETDEEGEGVGASIGPGSRAKMLDAFRVAADMLGQGTDLEVVIFRRGSKKKKGRRKRGRRNRGRKRN